MTEPSTLLLPPPIAPIGSGAYKSSYITALETQITSDPNNQNNPKLHAQLAWAYLEAGRFDKAIKSFETCYDLNTNYDLNIKQGKHFYAAKAASAIGHCFLKRSWTARNSDPNKAQDWREGIRWKLHASRLYEPLYQRNPADSKTIKSYALNADSIGYAYLTKPNQTKKYWLKGMRLKKKAYTLFEELSQTDPSTLENCAKTASYIGEEYLKASTRLRGVNPEREANPEQAEKYWLKGMEWKEKAYGSYKELSHTDSSKEQDCAKTAAQLGKEFADQENFEKAIEWYEKALQHDPGNKFVIQELEALKAELKEELKILEAHEEVTRGRRY